MRVSLLDVVIVLFVASAAAAGARSGFAVTAASALGTVLGLVGGAWLGVRFASQVDDTSWRAVIMVVVLVSVTVAVGSLGGRAGATLAVGLRRIHLGAVDAVGGALASIGGALLAVWLLAGSLASVPQAGLGPAIQRSAIIARLDEVLPAVPEVTSQLARVIDPLGLPRVFVGLEPTPSDPLPVPLDDAVQRIALGAAPSVVRVESEGCGGVLVGTGFVAAPELVVTNAHVVAGIATPTVEIGSTTLAAQPVLFDPDLDLAVLRVPGLVAPPLVLAAEPAERGDAGATLGFPEGAGLTVGPAAVLATFEALGRDIYDRSVVARPVLQLQAAVRPGNSGGPLVLEDGSVAGVVFARSITDSNIGYAIASSAVASRLAAPLDTTASTGSCVGS